MTSSFADSLRSNPKARFTDWLAQRAEPFWTQATTHPFTASLGDDSVSDERFGQYLIQDWHFIQPFVSVIGFAVARAPDMATKRRLARFIAGPNNEDSTYFERSFAALGITPADVANSQPGPVTEAYGHLLLERGRGGAYEDALACFVAAEWVYLTWGLNEARKPQPRRGYVAEWIDLHAVPSFETFVNWLRAEMDRAGAALSPERQEEIAMLFRRLCEVEAAFFDAAVAGEVSSTQLSRQSA